MTDSQFTISDSYFVNFLYKPSMVFDCEETVELKFELFMLVPKLAIGNDKMAHDNLR